MSVPSSCNHRDYITIQAHGNHIEITYKLMVNSLYFSMGQG